MKKLTNTENNDGLTDLQLCVAAFKLLLKWR